MYTVIQIHLHDNLFKASGGFFMEKNIFKSEFNAIPANKFFTTLSSVWNNNEYQSLINSLKELMYWMFSVGLLPIFKTQSKVWVKNLIMENNKPWNMQEHKESMNYYTGLWETHAVSDSSYTIIIPLP